MEGPGILEIRVHGVHGTTPVSMLGSPEVGQVAGDGMTGVYRTRDGLVPNRRLPRNAAVEAYSWGNLTSGISGLLGWVRRAGWLFLLPFALANLAYWGRPEFGTDSKPARRTARYVRTGALLLTALIVLTGCLFGVDLIAWQCYRGGTPGCGALPSVLDFLARDPWQTVPRRVAVGCVVPLLIVAGLWSLSGRTASRFEEVSSPEASSDEAASHPPGDEAKSGRSTNRAKPGTPDAKMMPPFEREAMWNGRDTVLRLRRLHIAFAVLVVVGYSGAPLAVGGLDSQQVSLWTWLLVAELSVAAIVAALVVWKAGSLRPGDVEHESGPGPGAEEEGRSLLRAAVALLVAHLVLLVWPTPHGEIPQDGDLLGHNFWFIGALVVLAALGALTFCSGKGRAAHFGAFLLVPVLGLSSTYAQRRFQLPEALPYLMWTLLFVAWAVLLVVQYRGKDSPAAWGGAGASMLLNAAGWTALLFTTAVVTFGADQLNGGEHDVADLQTSYAASQVGSNLDAADLDLVPQGTPYDRYTYVLSGDVTIMGGFVDVSSDRIVVRSGKLGTETLVRMLPGADAESRRISVRLGTTEMHNSELILPADQPLLVQDGCLRKGADTGVEPSGDCTVEKEGFVASAALDTKDAEVLVTTPDGSADVDVAVNDPPQAPLVLPQVLVWAPLVQVAWFLLAMVVAGLCLLRLHSRVKLPIRGAVEADSAIPTRDRGACVRARVRAAYAHRAEGLLDILGAVTVPIVLVLIIGASTGTAPWVVWPGFRPLAEVALWGVLGLSLGIVGVLSRMRTDDQARKGVGILWDLTTFWPRAAHPLAPPCYAERVVPELLVRIRWVLRDTKHLVVLSGHSQGSAILMAVVSRLSAEELERIRIITYGSQIRAWYGRIFPAAMGPNVLGYEPTHGIVRFSQSEPDAPSPEQPLFPTEPEDPRAGLAPDSLRKRLMTATAWLPGEIPPWVNLFRRSDPLGFRVFSDGEGADPKKAHDRYVPEVPVELGGDPGPRVMTHSGYPHSKSYFEALAEWEKTLPAGTFPPPFRTVPFFPAP